MAQKKTNTTITDQMDGQPAILLANGNWGVFNPTTNRYEDSGMRASPDDDSSAIKYFKLSNTSSPLTAPTRTGGWDSITTLNSALATAGWDEDPLETSKTNKFQWIATYGKENLVDATTTQQEGHMVFKPRYTLTNVRLWSNYADSPTIKVENGIITVTNPDGTTETQQIATAESLQAVMSLIGSMQEQLDGAVYSYSLPGIPTLSNTPAEGENAEPARSWRLDNSGNPITDPSTIADIYKTHVDDTYTDTTTYVSYRFQITEGASPSNPASYKWKVIEDSALTKALGDIAKLGDEKVTIFTAQPTKGYKKGNMWMQADGTILHALRDSVGNTYVAEDWIQPYATKAEVNAAGQAIMDDLNQAKADAQATANNLTTLESSLTSLETGVGKAIKDNIVDESEKNDLRTFNNNLDVEQSKTLSTVNYLISSKYLPAAKKTALQTKSDAYLGANGSIDQLQAAIVEMVKDGLITVEERTIYNTKLGAYKTHASEMENLIADARKVIDEKLESLADEKVDNLEIGGVNLLPSLYDMFNISGSIYGYFKISKDDTNLIGSIYEKDPSVDMSGVFFGFSKLGDEPSGGVDWFYHAGNLMKKTIKTSQYTYFSFFPNRRSTFDKIFSRFFIQIEKGTKPTGWSPAPEVVQAEIDKGIATVTTLYKNVNKGTTPLKPTKETEVSDGWSEASPAKIDGKVIWSINRTALKNGTYIYSNPANIEGAKGEDALSVSLNRQGSFRTYWRQIASDGTILSAPEPVSEVVGGVTVGDIKYVKVTASIYKGVRDVTEIAKTGGGNFKFYVNSVLKNEEQSEILLDAATYADGTDDDVQFEFDDANAKNW